MNPRGGSSGTGRCARWPARPANGSPACSCPDRTAAGGSGLLRDDPHWRDLVLFHEYFHGDDGTGLGASHQTGWTGTVALLPLLFRGTHLTGARR
ncbi:hypothetical protein AB0I60_27405 [Actinosynnema sp. NPDC050436]|uniref:hypothetical protein n=1 Tax=Actinosynnema sp. NPDC050436 TaxID=3155659 RepID=UPI00340700ED